MADLLNDAALSKRFRFAGGHPRLWVGFSGGLDSTVLLHMMSRWRAGQTSSLSPELHALHINHQLSPQAAHWQQHCAQVCAAWGINFHTETVTVTERGQGLEAAARDARYTAFARCLAAGDALLTAHHADDHLETWLLRLLRGSGLAGFAHLLDERDLGGGRIYRPLLDVTRAQLQHYAQQQGLTWIEDESNADARFDRNFLRQQVTPALQQRWPDWPQRLYRTQTNLNEAFDLLQEVADEDVSAVASELPWVLNSAPLAALSDARLKQALAHWLSRQGLPPLPTGPLQQAVHVVRARDDASPCIRWAGYELRRFGGRVYALAALPDLDADTVLPWAMDAPVAVAGGCLVAQAEGHLRPPAAGEVVSVRLRGENIPLRRGHDGLAKPLKKWLQVLQVPPWLRDRVPLLYYNERCVAVAGGLVTDAGFQEDAVGGFSLHWEPPHAYLPAV